jgi:flagellar hook-basal body complex protein FliE
MNQAQLKKYDEASKNAPMGRLVDTYFGPNNYAFGVYYTGDKYTHRVLPQGKYALDQRRNNDIISSINKGKKVRLTPDEQKKFKELGHDLEYWDPTDPATIKLAQTLSEEINLANEAQKKAKEKMKDMTEEELMDRIRNMNEGLNW